MADKDRIMPPEPPPVFVAGQLDILLAAVHAAKTRSDRKKAVAAVVLKIELSGVHPLVAIIRDSTDNAILAPAQLVLMHAQGMFISNQNLRGVIATWLVSLANKGGVDTGIRVQALSNTQAILAEGPIERDHAKWIRTALTQVEDDSLPPLDERISTTVANVINAIETK